MTPARHAVGLLGAMAFIASAAAAQTTPPPIDSACAHRGQGAGCTALDTQVVSGRTSNLVGIAASANQGAVGAADLALRPILRPGEIAENIPGVIVTQHSGSGKANQYFLRGFNLDHGTDLALSVDGVPVNMPSHAHGQGYADLNFLIPELVERVDFEKGPYYANVGDFGSAGALDIHYYDHLPSGFIHVDAGQVGYERAVAANDANAGGGTLLYAGELEHNDGPWTIGDDERKLDGMLSFTRGNSQSGFTVTGMAYHNDWRSTDQVPERAVTAGSIDEWGEIDSTDAGATGRYAASVEWHAQNGTTTTHVVAYGLHYDLDLFSDFTYFLDDPVHGDQIEQQDRRTVTGATATRGWIGTLGDHLSRTTAGFQLRNDDIDNGLYHTEARARLDDVTVNHIGETNAAPYVENATEWSDWFRSVVGVRGDFFRFDVHNVTGGTTGTQTTALASPKIALAFGPWDETELYADGGYGFHSNDARGVVSAANPATALPRSIGGEVGARTAVVPGLQSSVSLWLLDLESELVWDGDQGGNDPSGPTRRYGIELANFYTPVHWMTVDADYAWSHARFTDSEAGDYVPEALVATVDGGIAAHDLTGNLHGSSGGLRLRYFGPRPLTQDGTVTSKATTLLYADVGHDFSRRWSLMIEVFNLLDSHASDIDYYYVSRLKGEPLAGVADVHTHPAEPRELRLGITARF